MLIVHVALEILVAGNVALGRIYGAEIVALREDSAESKSAVVVVTITSSTAAVEIAGALVPSRPVELDASC